MADHFPTHVEDWSLQAIVRESSGEFTKILDDPDSFFDVSGMSYHDQQLDREFFASFPELFDVAGSYSDELEGLYKPFYNPPCSSLPVQGVLDFQEHGVESGVDEKQVLLDQSAGVGFVARANPGYTPKYKKSRKNQHKRVMIKVSAEGLSADMWAWRKYGQKPIKGSPFPRSYYRCSSSKGCLARKQVEQSCTDHGMFIVTYTAEHSHSQPTRRNSLAGTVRQKFPTVKQEKQDESMSSTNNNACSPNTPPQAMDVNMNSSQGSVNVQEKKQEHDLKGDEYHVMSDDFVLDDDFFSGLQDFDDFVSEPSLYDHNSVQAQLPLRSCS